MRPNAGCSTLHLTNAYHPTSGGVRTFYHALLSEAARQGRRMDLVVPGAHDRTEHTSDTTTIHTVRALASPVIDRRYRLILPSHYLLPGRSRLTAIVRAAQPDVLEVNDKFALCYLAGVVRKGWRDLGRRPVLVGHSAERTDDSMEAALGRASTRRLAAWYMATVYAPLFDYHVGNSEYTVSEITRVLPPWRRDHVSWLPMGVDTDTFAPRRRDAACRRTLLTRAGAAESATLLVYSGRLSAEKNVALLIAMMATLAVAPGTYRLAIAGDGPQRAGLEAAARQACPGHVLFLGHVSPATELARLIASADVFVHPNPREPFGIAPLEAMAAGIPVVLPDRGGVRAYATPRNAWLARPTPDAFATAVELAMRHEGARRHRAVRAREQALALDWRQVAARWFARYDELHVRGRHEWSTAGYVGAYPLPQAVPGPS